VIETVRLTNDVLNNLFVQPFYVPGLTEVPGFNQLFVGKEGGQHIPRDGTTRVLLCCHLDVFWVEEHTCVWHQLNYLAIMHEFKLISNFEIRSLKTIKKLINIHDIIFFTVLTVFN
jgi:hypothetical protein